MSKKPENVALVDTLKAYAEKEKPKKPGDGRVNRIVAHEAALWSNSSLKGNPDLAVEHLLVASYPGYRSFQSCTRSHLSLSLHKTVVDDLAERLRGPPSKDAVRGQGRLPRYEPATFDECLRSHVGPT